MQHQLRNALERDLKAADAVAVAAFRQYQHEYNDWAAFSRNTRPMTALFKSAEVVIATIDERVAGAVAYVGPGKPKGDLFPAEWPILRMLVVAPEFRGCGLGRALTLECISRAVRDKARLIALHTSPIMKVALPMYERIGFRLEREVAPIFGVPYAVYVKPPIGNNGRRDSALPE